MHITPDLALSAIIFPVYFYTLYKYGRLIEKISPGNTTKLKAKQLKALILENKDNAVGTDARNALIYLNISNYSIIIGVVLYIVFMILGMRK